MYKLGGANDASNTCNITQRWGIMWIPAIENGETYISMLDIDTETG